MRQIVDFLTELVSINFNYVEPTNKAHYLAVDVSWSMSSPIIGMRQMSCVQGAAVIAMSIARTEPKHSKGKILEILFPAESYGAIQDYTLWYGLCWTFSQQAAGKCPP